MTEKRHANGKVAAGDLTQRVGVEAIETRGVNVGDLVEKLIDAAGAERGCISRASVSKAGASAAPPASLQER